jgi:phosphoribosylformylglycinamidine synthase
MFNVKIYITLKKQVLDPQGKIIKNALHSFGFLEVEECRIGKYVELKVNAKSKDAAKKRVKLMCEKLLSNPIIEDFEFDIS